MKILITENQLDDLLNVKISVNCGQSYTYYEVGSLKNGGLILDCNPSDLKVICDTNILNYIKVFADGEKLNAGQGGGEDKLLCYWNDRSSVTCCIVYTDKPATKLTYQRQGAPESSVYPCDEGKHLFLAPVIIANGTFSLHLVYEDGSSSADLRDKLVRVK